MTYLSDASATLWVCRQPAKQNASRDLRDARAGIGEVTNERCEVWTSNGVHGQQEGG